jgi:hypothetical protein
MQTILRYKLNCNAPFLFGHFPVNEQLVSEYYGDYKFITLLREPCQRWISHYIYSRIRKSQRGERNDVESINQELIDYLATEESDIQGSIYSYYFNSDTSYDLKNQHNEIYVQSIQTLKRFHLVGFLDDVSKFIEDLGKSLDISFDLNVAHQRKTTEFVDPLGYSYKDYKALFTEEIMLIVREKCKMDTEIYSFLKCNVCNE